MVSRSGLSVEISAPIIMADSSGVLLPPDLIIGADISTDKPLRDTIQFLSDTVDQIIAYSAELGE